MEQGNKFFVIGVRNTRFETYRHYRTTRNKIVAVYDSEADARLDVPKASIRHSDVQVFLIESLEDILDLSTLVFPGTEESVEYAESPLDRIRRIFDSCATLVLYGCRITTNRVTVFRPGGYSNRLEIHFSYTVNLRTAIERRTICVTIDKDRDTFNESYSGQYLEDNEVVSRNVEYAPEIYVTSSPPIIPLYISEECKRRNLYFCYGDVQ